MALFGSSGIRDLVGRELIEKVFKIGFIIGESYPTVVIAQDTRTSGDALKYAIIPGLLARGCQVYDAGMLPTPSLAYITRNFHAGIIITASHNPGEYNGIKLWNSDGSAFNTEQRAEIETKLQQDLITTADWQLMQTLKYLPESIEQHLCRILNDIKLSDRIKVAVDCGGGAASPYTPALLQRLGCEVVALNSTPTGIFPRNPEPVAENLKGLCNLTITSGASAGIAHDGDADRMMAVDEKGRFISGDKLLIILARELNAKQIVTTVDASMIIEECGFNVIRTKVGDAFVSECLVKGGDFGGEPSGSWIFPEVSLCPDGIYAAAIITKIASERKLSELTDALPSYPIIRGKIALSFPLSPDYQKDLINGLSPISTSDIDGIRLEFRDSWLLVRKSGTEPSIRITVEARDVRKAELLYNRAKKLIEQNIMRE